jgi:predicted porin
MSPNHGSISTVGFKKMVPFVNNNWLDIQMEFTQLAMSVDYVVRGTGNTYEYQGSYTNQSRVIGAGIGNGSNMQTLQLKMKKCFSKQGITFQRIVHDALREPNLSNHERWIDFAIGAQYQKRLKQFLVHGHAQYVDINNYGWMSKQNRTNIYAYAGVTYFFNQRKK